MGYPVEFRRKVFKLKEKKGLTYEEVSELFGVSMRTLFRWNTRIEIKKKAPKPRVISLEELKNDVKNHPDSYQWERAQRFGVSQHCIQHWLNFLGISCKKNTKTSKSQRKYTYKLPE
ncbi:Transposase [Piscirickettsia salmonis]|uniref:IS630 transposase-related protein n=1 Tax=Piscirickettsia salmonis TaxID=1238 RepID=UPI0012B93644|nr:IS630 transposase-related protein [Piscirickettsia salmonis]QGP48658.1 Transposase [Piscirickettsia salmonis]